MIIANSWLSLPGKVDQKLETHRANELLPEKTPPNILLCITRRMYTQASCIKKESRHLYLTISLQVIIQESIDIIAGYKMNSRKCCYY